MSRQLSEEHKRKLKEGRERALAAKKADQSKPAEDQAKKRPIRTPLAEARDLLTTEGIPEGYIGRWENDEKNKVQRLQELGYVHVYDTPRGRIVVGDDKVDAQRQTGSVVSKIVGTDDTGKPLVAYLMAQRKEWYEEDQKFKQSEIDKVADQIKKKESDAGLTPM